jgi:hypothetical protein
MNEQRQTIPIPTQILRDWNDLLRADRVDFARHSFKDWNPVVKWAVSFADGKKMEISIHTTFRKSGERYGFLNAEAMLFDKDGHPLVFTEPRRALDGDWELCTLAGDQYSVSVVGSN